MMSTGGEEERCEKKQAATLRQSLTTVAKLKVLHISCKHPRQMQKTRQITVI